MLKKKTIAILSILICCLCSISILHWMSVKPTKPGSGFTRKFPPHILPDWKAIVIEPHLKIIGNSSHTIYLGSPFDPLTIYQFNPIDNSLKRDSLKLARPYKFAWKSLAIKANNQGIFLTEGITPTILHSGWKMDSLFASDKIKTTFTDILPLDSNSFVLKAYDDKIKQQILIKTTSSPYKTTKKPNILTKQVDGIFCTEGDLLFDPPTKKIVYVYRYRNEYLVMDMDLNLLNKEHTIDTISKARIQVAEFKEAGQIHHSLSAPPFVVNKMSRVYGKLLFIRSNVMADNENPEIFNSKPVIDIYQLEQDRYLYSFYIPTYQNIKMRDFTIADHHLIALYDNHLISFGLNLP